jgi:hypothetical protein
MQRVSVFIVFCFQCLHVVGEQAECQGNSPSVRFVNPVHDTAVEIEAHGKLGTEIHMCNVHEKLELIIYLNSNIIYRNKASPGAVIDRTDWSLFFGGL